jgi:hypothetical protein
MLVCLVACSLSQLATAGHEAASLDWQLQSPTSTSYCSGYYLPYQLQPLDQPLTSDEQPLYSNADSSEYEQGITYLKGNVEFRQGNQKITGEDRKSVV